MKDLNLLREDVINLKRDIVALHREKQSSTVPSTCHIKVYFPHSVTPPSTDSEVSQLLSCSVVRVTRVSPFSLKVKIPRVCLFNALQSSAPNSHLVHIGKNHVPRTSSSMHIPMQVQSSNQNSICVASWNCRGLHNSIPYIKELLSYEVDFLVLQEHWLWPFQLDQLSSIDHNYSYTAVCDGRLSPTSDLTRGCGGTAILWKKMPQRHNLNSDRICGVQIPLPHSHILTILGVYYMPSSDQPQEIYSSYVDVVDRAISLSLPRPL